MTAAAARRLGPAPSPAVGITRCWLFALMPRAPAHGCCKAEAQQGSFLLYAFLQTERSKHSPRLSICCRMLSGTRLPDSGWQHYSWRRVSLGSTPSLHGSCSVRLCCTGACPVAEAAKGRLVVLSASGRGHG